MERRASLLAAALAASLACGERGPEQVYVDAPWPASHTVVVVRVDATGEATGEPRILAPGAAVEWTLEDETTRLRVLTFADGADVTRCGATRDTGRARLPSADAEYLVASLNGAPRVLEADDASPALYFATCDPPTTAVDCPTYDVIRYDATAAPDRNLSGLATSDEGILVSLAGRADEGQSHLLKRDGDDLVPVPSDPLFGPDGLRDLVMAEGRIFTANGNGVFEIDAFGRATKLGDAHPAVEGVLAADAETIAAFGPGGLEPITGDLPAITDPVEYAWSVGDPRSAGTVYAIVDYGILKLRGGEWVVDDRFGQESWQVLGGDAEVVAAGNQTGEVQIRRGPEDWQSLGVPPGNGSRIRVVQALGGGRIMVGGNDGLLAVWDGQGWCEVPPFVVSPIDDIIVVGGSIYVASRHIESVVGDAGAVFRLLVAPP